MADNLSWALQRVRDHTLRLVTRIPSSQSCLQGAPGEHHPTWILGHLLLADTYLLSLLEVAALPRDFQQLLDRYGPSSHVLSSPVQYDPFADLVERLVHSGTQRQEAVDRMSATDLIRSTPDPLLVRSQPTIGHHLYVLVCHEGYHSGALAAWRRHHGFPAVPWAFATPMA